MYRLPVVFAALSVLLAAGCSSISEYDTLWSWRAEVLSLPELSPLGSVDGLEDGVAVLPLSGGIFLVSSLEGDVFRCSAGERAVLDSSQLSGALSGGCGEMAA